jgi:ABC-type transport system involved in multi-copper enzyme maturation permease subunit
MGLHRLAGPLLSKELRVSSRRRRIYVLRCVYVVVLMMFIATVWVGSMEFQRGGAMWRAQMERAAKEIVLGIVWFQFIAAQIVVVITMSTAISDEVYGRTLGVLMTTPMSSLQVVMGKLFSRLLQILLLVATSLPLLAIVRVLGGVPWSYLILSLIITLITVVFVGAVTLLFSTLSRKVYVVVIASSLTVAALFGALPFLGAVLLDGFSSDRVIASLLSHVNPYILLRRCTNYMLSPGRRAMVSVSSVVSCCTLLLACSGYFLGLAVYLVRRVALRRVMGQPTVLDSLRPDRLLQGPGQASVKPRATAIRRVIGPPMIWKELTCALSRRQKLALRLAVGTEIMLIAIAYMFPVIMPFVGYDETHLLFLWGFLGLGVLFTVTTSATLISTERESRTWPLLLVSPLRDRDILIGKCVGVLRRCGPVWLPLLAYIAAFTYADCFHGWAVVQIVLIVLSAFAFLTASGFYFGSRFDRTTEAVTANLMLAGVVWCVLPLVAHWAAAIIGTWDERQFFVGVPFFQILLLMRTTLEGGDGYYRGLWFGYPMNAGHATVSMLISLLVYVVAARVFLWRAVRAFRQRIV